MIAPHVIHVDAAPRKALNQPADVDEGRGGGGLRHSSSKSLSSQKLIDFTVLIRRRVGLTQARQPLLGLYCMFPELQDWSDIA